MPFSQDTVGNEVDRGPVLLTAWRGTESVNRWPQGRVISSEGQGAMGPQQWPRVGLLGQGRLLRESDSSERNLKEKERLAAATRSSRVRCLWCRPFCFLGWRRRRRGTATQLGSLREQRLPRWRSLRETWGRTDRRELGRGLRLKGDSSVSFSKLEPSIF